MKHYLTIEDGKLVDYPGFDEVKIVEVRSIEQLHKILNSTDDVLCSSSIDFPEEHTTDPNVLALVAEIRGDV